MIGDQSDIMFGALQLAFLIGFVWKHNFMTSDSICSKCHAIKIILKLNS